jgi:6-phosphofructokinase 1
MKIGVLVGGGDAPGLNAAVRAVFMQANEYGYEVLGIKGGWAGLLKMDTMPLNTETVEEIHSKGGIILYTSRTNPFKTPDGPSLVMENMKKLGIDALVVIGGEDTLGVALKLYEMNVPLVAVPKTIDNDLSGTDYSIGFDTAVSIVSDAIDRLHTTAESHHRTIIVEVMGRYTGWIALYGGLAGGANLILIPEVPYCLDEICEAVKRRVSRGKFHSIIVVAEGAKPAETESFNFKDRDRGIDEFGHVRLGGIGSVLEKLIEAKTGLETRSVVLGHIQRGGSPTAFDRVLATRLGVKAIQLVKEGKFGQMSSFQGNKIVSVELKEALKKRKTVSPELYELAKLFFK